MIPSQELINGMRLAADKWENDELEYNHSYYNICLLGTLTQVTSNLSALDVEYGMWEDPGVKGTYSYPNNTIQYCSTTKLPMNLVYQHLYKLGIQTQQDLFEIEYCGSNDEFYHPSKEDAIAYFRRKADELETQLLSSSVNKVNEVVSQSVGI